MLATTRERNSSQNMVLVSASQTVHSPASAADDSAVFGGAGLSRGMRTPEGSTTKRNARIPKPT